MQARRVVVVITGRDPNIRHGGTRSYSCAFGRAALLAGYEPHLFCIGRDARTEETPFGVVHCARSPFRPYSGLMVAAHAPFVTAAIEDFVAQTRMEGPVLIHSLGPWSGVGATAARQLTRRGIRCITVATPFTTYLHQARGKLRGATAAHGWLTAFALYWELLWTLLTVNRSERRGLRRADLVAVNYDSVRNIIVSQFGSSINFAKLPYSSEAAFVRLEAEDVPVPDAVARIEPRGAPLIVAVSRQDARKGLDVLLRALALLRGDGVPFRACLIGAGSLLERHRRFAEQLGLGECVALPGHVEDAYACLRHADIFALPSIEEGSGAISLLEAMQAGVAPVVTRVDGIPEDVADGESAFMVEPGDSVSLARALRQLIEDPEIRARLARGARAAYRARFTAEHFALALRENYTRLGVAPLDPSLAPPALETGRRS